MDFKIGDKIKYNEKDHTYVPYGSVGKVIGTEEDDSWLLVEWEQENRNFHDNHGLGKKYHCWNVSFDRVIKITSKQLELEF